MRGGEGRGDWDWEPALSVRPLELVEAPRWPLSAFCQYSGDPMTSLVVGEVRGRTMGRSESSSERMSLEVSFSDRSSSPEPPRKGLPPPANAKSIDWGQKEGIGEWRFYLWFDAAWRRCSTQRPPVVKL